jgi:hypothetical protein
MPPERHERRGLSTPADPRASFEIEPRRLTLIEPVARPVPTGPATAAPPSVPRLGTRLRLERERRCIALVSIAAHTKIGIGLLEGLERNDVGRWPGGIFRRAFIRAYAEAVGLDADVVTREFLDAFPDPAEPQPVQVLDSASTGARRTLGDATLRLTLAETETPGANRRMLTRLLERGVAVVSDMAVLTVIGTTLFIVLHAFWIPMALTVIGYYGASIVLFGRTPGVALFASESSRERRTRRRGGVVSARRDTPN